MSERTNTCEASSGLLGFLSYLGGFMFYFNADGYGFWDALIWPYYIGRYLAKLAIG